MQQSYIDGALGNGSEGPVLVRIGARKRMATVRVETRGPERSTMEQEKIRRI